MSTNHERVPDADREEPPVLLATMLTASAGVERGLRGLINSINMRVRMFLWGAGTILVFVVVLISSVAQRPGWEGAVQGLFGGGFTALLFAAGFGWLQLWAGSRRPVAPDDDGVDVQAVNASLAPQLRELNAIRADVIRKVKARSVTCIPLGMIGGCAFWLMGRMTDEPPGPFELLIWLVVGAAAGEGWAASKLQREYTKLYKSRVLPALAGRVGQLTYKPASAADVQQLTAARILPQCDSVHADDEISGMHRGLGIRIIEARLRRRSGDDTRTVFDGLLVEIMLPRQLTGTTAVTADQGVIGNMKTRWQTEGLERVRLEHPEFERRYEVYSSDQVEARALLTPAFMERFTALAAVSGFALPGAFAEGNRLVVALPKSMGTRDLFEPPAYWKPAGGRALVGLERDIRAVLDVADTVVALDFWAAGRR